jgi:hypothetical protein
MPGNRGPARLKIRSKSTCIGRAGSQAIQDGAPRRVGNGTKNIGGGLVSVRNA